MMYRDREIKWFTCELICRLENVHGMCGSIHVMLILESSFSLCNFYSSPTELNFVQQLYLALARMLTSPRCCQS